MARKSREDASGMLWRTGEKAPAPPAHLDATAKRLWKQITASYPVDYFKPGADILLEHFVEATVMHRFYMGMWRKDPDNPEFTKAITMVANSLNQTAQKLRLSNSARLHRHSGILTEENTGPRETDDGNVLLFGSGKF